MDFINISTVPTLSENLGAAKQVAKTHLPYSVSFIINDKGELLDGTPMHIAIAEIDKQTDRQPFCYIIFCTPPSVATRAMQADHPEYARIKGIKANGSCKPPEELNKAKQALADPADEFSTAVVELSRQQQWKIIGGCCGTDRSHFRRNC